MSLEGDVARLEEQSEAWLDGRASETLSVLRDALSLRERLAVARWLRSRVGSATCSEAERRVAAGAWRRVREELSVEAWERLLVLDVLREDVAELLEVACE